MTPDAFTEALAERLRQRGVDYRVADLEAFAAGLPPALEGQPDLEALANRFVEASRFHAARAEAAVLWKVALRLLPFLFLLYIVNILDRANIGFARLQMVDDQKTALVGASTVGFLGAPAGQGPLLAASALVPGSMPILRETDYALGAGLFYVGYLLFEVPSNLILRRTGARVWISRILLSWGVVSSCMMFVTGPWGFSLLRILLGIAEAGFFPGIILYLSYWFPARQRAKTIALFMVAGPVAGIIGNPLSGAVLQFMDRVGGMAGWQWVFLLEGIPAVLLGVVTLYYLTDRPAQAKWLTLSERTWLAWRMEGEEQQRQDRHGLTFLRAMADPRVWLLIAVYFTVAAGDNAFGFYLPKLLDDRFVGWPRWEIGWLAALPSVAAVVGMVGFGVSSDRTGERRWHVAVAAFLAAAGWVMVAVASSPWFLLLGLAVASLGMKSMLPTFWTLPTSFLSGAAAAGGIALINSVANLGGILGPNVMGQVQTRTGSFTGASLFMAAALCVGGSLVFLVRREQGAEVSRDSASRG
jgi:MFS transporter, ACS family, tartrate transporter